MPLVALSNPDDPLFDFEHMMQHRQYFAVMEELFHFTNLPYLLDPAYEQNVPATAWNQAHQQAHNDFSGDLPSNYADGYTLTTVTPPAATGTGTSTGTINLTIASVTNTIIIGSTVSGTGVPAGTTIVSQASGPVGGAGVYRTNQATTLSNVALTMTHPPYQQANPLDGGTFGIPQAGILVEGTGDNPGSRAWWTFVNHQQHYAANNAILPFPTMQPTQAGTPPGVETASNPWWWAFRAPILYPFW